MLKYLIPKNIERKESESSNTNSLNENSWDDYKLKITEAISNFDTMTKFICNCKYEKNIMQYYVGRYNSSIGLSSKNSQQYGNPYVIGPDGNRSEVLDKYLISMKLYFDKSIIGKDLRNKLRMDLRNKVLGCWCRANGTKKIKSKTCHADLLAFIANTTDEELFNLIG